MSDNPGIRKDPYLSVVVPVYNEEENLELLHQRLTATLEKLTSRYEIIMVDDGQDGSLELITRLSEKDPHVKFISFTRNFGHESATTAGLDFASGDAVVIIDADLQDPPEVIEEMVRLWEEGYEVVYGKRKGRKKEPITKKLSSFFFYRLMRKIADVEVPVDTGDFRLIDRKMVEHFRKLRERNRFIRLEIAWLGGRTKEVLYDREPRHAGRTKYNFSKRLRLSIDGIVSFSAFPLRFMSYIGFLIFFLSIAAILVVLVQKLFFDIQIPGYAFLVISLFALGGVQILLLGFLGEYIARIYKEVQNRPHYLIDLMGGFDGEGDGRETLS